MSKIKKIIFVVGMVFILMLAGIVALFIKMSSDTKSYTDFNFGSLDLSTAKDGTYIGSEDGGIVKATVEVTIKDHTITNIKILSHDNGKGKPAEVIVDDIIAKNSLEVDAISGATYSSDVIRAAVFNALSK